MVFKNMRKRTRLDQLLVEGGFFENIEKAQFAIASGMVKTDGQKITHTNALTNSNSVISITEQEKYVSRGGYKLEGFIKDIDANVKGKVAIYIGASTGGFTDCLMQAGVEKVYAVDVGHGQIAWKLRENHNVIVLEKQNARYKLSIDESVDIVVIDVSFISVLKILPNVLPLMKNKSDIFVLVKPQFEAKKEDVPRGGVIDNPRIHAETLQNVSSWGRSNGLRVGGIRRSVITGAKGNVEFFINFQK